MTAGIGASISLATAALNVSGIYSRISVGERLLASGKACLIACSIAVIPADSLLEAEAAGF